MKVSKVLTFSLSLALLFLIPTLSFGQSKISEKNKEVKPPEIRMATDQNDLLRTLSPILNYAPDQPKLKLNDDLTNDLGAFAFLTSTYTQNNVEPRVFDFALAGVIGNRVYVLPNKSNRGYTIWMEEKNSDKFSELLRSKNMPMPKKRVSYKEIRVFLSDSREPFFIVGVSGEKTESVPSVDIFFSRGFYSRELVADLATESSPEKNFLDQWQNPQMATQRSQIELRYRLIIMSAPAQKLRFLLNEDNRQAIYYCLNNKFIEEKRNLQDAKKELDKKFEIGSIGENEYNNGIADVEKSLLALDKDAEGHKEEVASCAKTLFDYERAANEALYEAAKTIGPKDTFGRPLMLPGNMYQFDSVKNYTSFTMHKLYPDQAWLYEPYWPNWKR